MLWFSVECHGFKFLKFHSVTDDDIMTVKTKNNTVSVITLLLPLVTETEFLPTISIQYQADKQ